MPTSKELFKVFCEKEKGLPIFMTYDWLNTVAPDNWDVVIEENNGNVLGVFPYVIKNKYGFEQIIQPELTPYGGIWIKYPEDQKYATKVSYEKEIFFSLIEKLPTFDLFTQKFHPKFNNWLPFYWKGFQQTTAYTYVIDESNTEIIFSEFKENIRREIRKAQRTLLISTGNDINILYQIKAKSYQFNKQPFNISKDYITNIFSYCTKKKCGELIIAKDDLENIHAAAFFIWDDNTTYYLLGASDPLYKNSGAMSLLMWEGIQRSVKRSTSFNFEGSMIEDIERFFRGFGARQTPYFVITKTNSNFIKIKKFFMDIYK
jgi:lipid II:glycine glycyltransferase (peptidoglycan interpeptide bridge formation enzyme)